MRDVLVVGGGIAGLSFALALRRSFGPDFAVSVIDGEFGARLPSARASALTAGSRRVLEALDIWPRIESHAQPILKMTITDSRRNDAVRPEFLHFDMPAEPGAAYAHMIHNSDLTSALEQEIVAYGVDVIRGHAARIVVSDRKASVRLVDGRQIEASLLVGADGAFSRVRNALNIQTIGRDYGRSAIVATMAHDVDHEGCATQHFLPAGPFAMLPLQGRRSSIVWTERTDDAAAALRLDDSDFIEQVERRFGFSLGPLSLVDRPAAYPLRLQVSRRFIGTRTALIGDAARVIHPLAGQGLNLAFRDLAALIDCVAQPVRLGLDPGGPSCLEGYQRARLFDSVAMAAATDGLHRLFANDLGPLRLLRDMGLGLVDRAPRLKRALIREAAGLQGQIPTLMRGRLP